MKKPVLYAVLIASLLAATSCSGKKDDTAAEKKGAVSFAVFVPGVTAGSPTYEMLVEGAGRAAGEAENSEITVIEAGFNQGEWENKLTALAGTGKYSFIITSNPALSEICNRVSAVYPEQKFIVLDSYMEGNSNIYTFLYNNYEQAYLAGVMGALVTQSNMPGVNSRLKAGLVAGQEYPMMTNVIRPGYEKGLKSINSGMTLDFRIVGNWYDASKGAELANSMYNSGVDVILSIAGGAGQGVLSAARERKKYVLWFDDNGYSLSEGQVIGCAAIRQDRAAYEITKKAIEGTLEYGSYDIAGVKEGYVYFIDDDPVYLKVVPEEIRDKMNEVIEKINSGEIVLGMPLF